MSKNQFLLVLFVLSCAFLVSTYLSFTVFQNIPEFAKIIVPLVFGLLMLAWTNMFSFLQLIEGRKQDLKKDVTLRLYNNEIHRLEKLYYPMLSLLKMNAEFFNRFGGSAFKTDDSPEVIIVKEKIWKNIRSGKIVPNNLSIVKIVQENFHLLGDTERDLLQDFITHAVSYENFDKEPTTAHAPFEYPDGIIQKVEKSIESIKNKVTEYERILGNFLEK